MPVYGSNLRQRMLMLQTFLSFMILREEPRSTPCCHQSKAGCPAISGRMEVASVPQLYQERANLSFAPAAQFIARLKPCIGHVFATQLAGYSHWAYGDFDAVLTARCSAF